MITSIFQIRSSPISTLTSLKCAQPVYKVLKPLPFTLTSEIHIRFKYSLVVDEEIILNYIYIHLHVLMEKRKVFSDVDLPSLSLDISLMGVLGTWWHKRHDVKTLTVQVQNQHQLITHCFKKNLCLEKYRTTQLTNQKLLFNITL